MLTLRSDRAVDPGGQFEYPTPQADQLLYVTLQPRYSIYLESDKTGSFIINATLSHIFGQPFGYDLSATLSDSDLNSPSLLVQVVSEGKELVSSSVRIGATERLVDFSLSALLPRYKPYQISLRGTLRNSSQIYTASTQLYVLPSRSYGSAVKIDNLYGGLYVQNAHNAWTGWYPLFPNGGYGDGNHVMSSNISFTNLDRYAEEGFNNINIVPDGGRPDQAYPMDDIRIYWDHMDELNLFNVYDLRFAFQNATRIRDQVEMWKNRTTLLMWYTADEPDGWVYPLNSTKIAYDQLKELDPYHPVSLVLNCQNFYYKDYASGGDIIFEDAYPVAINATWSIPWNTACNTTYGDCGCDNCVGELADVSSRLDDIQTYQANLEGQSFKPTWSVLQVFGEQSYWPRIPTTIEVLNMMMLSINHNVKGITYWIYPSTNDVNIGSGKLGKIFQTSPGIDFVFGSNAIKGLKVLGADIDASAWILGDKMMIGIASLSYENVSGIIKITLPKRALSVDKVLYGSESWTVKDNTLTTSGLKGLEIGVLVLRIDK
ncbi:hypothetical protein B0O99DRAFT_525640 [Bisporella sp. PMI_857]|nr:hypothetical protein B0O99DRAFT_525640 [Bisporella sp. PMI_857]